MTLPTATKELVDEALNLISGQINGLYPFEPFYLRGSFNILYQSTRQPRLFSKRVQQDSLTLCDFFISSQLDLFYAYVFKAVIYMRYEQYNNAIEAIYQASHQFIPRATLTYPFLTDYLTIFNTLFKLTPSRMESRQFPLLTMTDIDGTAHKFTFDMTKKRTEAYKLPLEEDILSNTSLQPPQTAPSPPSTISNSNPTPAIGKTPSVRNNHTSNNEYGNAASSNGSNLHATPQAKPHNFQPMSSKISQSATKNTTTHSSEHKPANGRVENVPAFALPEADDEEFDIDNEDSAFFSSNEAFYSTNTPSKSSKSLHNSSSLSNTSSGIVYDQGEFDEDEVERIRRELEELERSREKLNRNGFLFQISAAFGAVSVASLWVLGVQYRHLLNHDWAKEELNEWKSAEDSKAEKDAILEKKELERIQLKTKENNQNVYAEKEKEYREAKVLRKVPTGTDYTYVDEKGEVRTIRRPQRHTAK